MLKAIWQSFRLSADLYYKGTMAKGACADCPPGIHLQ
jgi:hypothetical protein